MAPKQLDARTLAIVCVAAAMLAPWANAQTQPAETTPIPGDGSANANGPTLAPATGAACTVDTDCGIAEFCDCGASGDTTTLAPPGDSPAAPLARTPLALFVGMLATACQQSAHAAGPGCRCKVGQRTGVSTAQNTANGTDGAGNPSGNAVDAGAGAGAGDNSTGTNAGAGDAPSGSDSGSSSDGAAVFTTSTKTATTTTTTATATTTTTTITVTTTATTTTTTTTTTKTIESAIFKGEVATIKGWVQTGFAEFKGKAVKLVRCYSMAQSGDGGTSRGFHTACDNKGPTVTVVKTTQGWIFGGAADKDWASSGGSVASDSAFLFCVKCAGAKSGDPPTQLKLNGKYNQEALYHSSSRGPWFGNGYDLYIATTPGGTSTASSSGLGGSYTCPAGQYNTAPCNNYLAGSKQFTVADYEVFVIEAI